MTYDQVIAWLHESSNQEKVILKKRNFKIVSKNSLGIYHKDIKDKATEIGYNTELAIQLFNSGIYEARVLCSKIFDPNDLTSPIAEKWVKTFENWEICDSFSMGLFAKSDLAIPKVLEWSSRSERFEKRACFATMISYCLTNKESNNEIFKTFLSIIKEGANDNRLYVKKAVNWALRSVGKRNIDLNGMAITVAYQMIQYGNKSAKWIGSNSLRELKSESIHMLDYPRDAYRAVAVK